MTLVKILDFVQRIIHELDVGSTTALAFTNLLSETVQDYHLFFGVKTRTLVQQLVYAAGDIPGNFLELSRAKSDIVSRLERDYVKVSGKNSVLQYTLPLDDNHLDRNPPMRRQPTCSVMEKSTQTEGRFHDKPVKALILN